MCVFEDTGGEQMPIDYSMNGLAIMKVEKTIKKMREGKAMGYDGVYNEMLNAA